MLTYFGVPDDRPDNAEGNLGSWPTPAATRLYVGLPDDGVERIGIQNGKTIEMQLTGGNGYRIEVPAGGPVQLMPMIAGGPDPAIAAGDKYKFKLSALHDGKTSLSARDATGVRRADLDVVVGNFEKQPSMEIDLIAKVGQGSDSQKIHAIQGMLNNRWLGAMGYTNTDNVFDQNAPSNRSDKF